jgi:uncharacterized protein YjbI with pentapeptide repeats
MVNEIRSTYGELIYSLDVEFNTFHGIVERAVRDGISLCNANLQYTNLQSVDLRYADLQGASLQYANLIGASLQYADLRGSNLRGADLRGSNLRGAGLQDANLQYVDLRGADLRDSNLEYTYFKYANLEGALLPDFKIVPETGEFFGYKKLRNNVVIKVKIPAHAERTNSIGSRKCRASEVEVLEVLQGEIPEGEKIQSTNYGSALYSVGEVVKADWFDPDIRVECTNGIHFFMSFEEAQAWY